MLQMFDKVYSPNSNFFDDYRNRVPHNLQA